MEKFSGDRLRLGRDAPNLDLVHRLRRISPEKALLGPAAPGFVKSTFLGCGLLEYLMLVDAKALKRAREERLLSITALAKLAGVSSKSIYRMENGGEIKLLTFRKLLIALGYSVTDKDRFVIE
jgi:DNA-binding XRE family transcriptional regulator